MTSSPPAGYERAAALAFADRRVDGTFPVAAEDGSVVARISARRGATGSFEATAADGTPLCSGRRHGFLSSTWDAVDPAGTRLLSIRRSFWGASKAVTLADGRALTITGRLFARDWQLADQAGTPVLAAERQGRGPSLHPDAFVVRPLDASMSLALVVAVVELNRLIVKAGRAAVSAASSGAR